MKYTRRWLAFLFDGTTDAKKKMIRHIHIEPETRICAYPPCRKPFIPKKSNQICCNPKHTYNMQQTRTRHRRKERHAQSKP